eukprot:SAG11_NODE_18569_length_487_cov_0.793814_1_plen_20_part_10
MLSVLLIGHIALSVRPASAA